MNEILTLPKVEQFLATTTDVNEITALLDQVDAALLYTHKQHLHEAKEELATAKQWIQHKLGTVIKDVPEGKRGPKVSAQVAPNLSKSAQLKEWGIERTEAQRLEKIATLTPTEIEEHQEEVKAKGGELTDSGLIKLVDDKAKKAKAEKEQKALEERLAPTKDLPQWHIAHEPFLEATPSEPIDLILTDPPYEKAFREAFGFQDLAWFAIDHLRPGGILAVMPGDLYLPETLSQIEAATTSKGHLTYLAPIIYMMPGGQGQMRLPIGERDDWLSGQRAKLVHLFYKPGAQPVNLGTNVLTTDALSSQPTSKHKWGQNLSGFALLVERLSKTGELVCDPCVGGGTTGIASLHHGRRFLGYDIDSQAATTARERIEAWQHGTS